MNYTTIDQSRKLVELGLNPDTADMWYGVFHGYIGRDNDNDCHETEEISKYPIQSENAYKREGIPCWSVGALLEILSEKALEFDDGSVLIGSWNKTWDINMLDCPIPCQSGFKSPIEACYNMVVWLLENNYIEKKEK